MASSWIAGTDDSGFGIDNLPLGVFSLDDVPRPGVAIGPSIADLSMLIRERLIDDETLLDARTLNDFLAYGPGAWRSLRATLQRLFGDDATEEERELVTRALVPRAAATMHLPIAVQDYVDFYSGIEHATNLGKILRPGGEPLAANYRYIPIGYHGRASTVVVSDTSIVRPSGQRKLPTESAPTFGRRVSSTSNSKWRLSPASATRWVRRSGVTRYAITSTATSYSTIGARATSRRGNISRSAHSSASRSRRRFHRGWCRSMPSNHTVSPIAFSIPNRCRICAYARTSPTTSRSR